MQLTPGTKGSLCFDVAFGLEYLHFKGVLHGNLNVTNCLVATRFPMAKLADFNLYPGSGTGKPAPPREKWPHSARWLAPEVLAHGLYTKESDIWSMG